MKILHVCLANFYIDNYGYQENILPKFHKKMGYDVKILASTETFIDNQKLGYTIPSTYYNEDGIEVTRLPYRKFFSNLLTRKIRLYKGITNKLLEFMPDIIFIHDLQFCGIRSFANYAKKYDVEIYVDNHNDFINSCKGFLSRYILHGIIYKKCSKIIMPYVKKFYGVLPARCDFLNKVYGIPKDKIELLVMGVDDSLFDYSSKNDVRRSIREKMGIPKDSFVIIHGGKIDSSKRTIELIKAFLKCNLDNTYLVIFGEVSKDIKQEFDVLINDNRIIYLNWVKANEIFKYYFASDLGFFGGTHSVLWEQAIGCGLPCVFRKWDGILHISVNNNCFFIEDPSVENFSSAIMYLYKTEEYYEMLKNSEIARKYFSYSSISRRAIGLGNDNEKN